MFSSAVEGELKMGEMVKKFSLTGFFVSIVFLNFGLSDNLCKPLKAEETKTVKKLQENNNRRPFTIKGKMTAPIPRPLKQEASSSLFEMDDFDEEELDEPDQLEFFNRVMYDVNGFLDTVLFHPLSRIYGAVVPSPVRKSLHTFQEHILTPVTFLNLVLQGRGEASVNSCLRFFINTTIGMLGFFDVAHEMGFKKKKLILTKP